MRQAMRFLILFISLFSLSFLKAQNVDHKWSIGVGYTASNMEGLLNIKALKPVNYTGGVHLSFSRYLSPSFNLKLQGAYGSIYYPHVHFYPSYESNMFHQEKFYDADLRLEYKFNNNYLFKENAIVQPYLFIGLGTDYLNKDWNSFFPWGAGIKFKVTKCLAIDLETCYKVNLDNAYSYLQHQAGLVFSFGKAHKKTETIINQKVVDDLKDLAIVTTDSDNDGVNDSKDECPYVAGLLAYNGCPDSDLDGIGDSRDNCPTEAGVAENQGCPIKAIDSDEDGVVDAVDKCPFEKGLISNNGCPFVPQKEVVKEEVKITTNQVLENKHLYDFKSGAELFYSTSNAELNEDQKQTLDALAAFIIANNSKKVIIKGYTSNIGTDKANIDLSMQRALKVSNYLTAKGVNIRIVSVQGWGPYNAKYSNTTPAESIKNQRVEVVLE